MLNTKEKKILRYLERLESRQEYLAEAKRQDIKQKRTSDDMTLEEYTQRIHALCAQIQFRGNDPLIRQEWSKEFDSIHIKSNSSLIDGFAYGIALIIVGAIFVCVCYSMQLKEKMSIGDIQENLWFFVIVALIAFPVSWLLHFINDRVLQRNVAAWAQTRREFLTRKYAEYLADKRDTGDEIDDCIQMNAEWRENLYGRLPIPDKYRNYTTLKFISDHENEFDAEFLLGEYGLLKQMEQTYGDELDQMMRAKLNLEKSTVENTLTACRNLYAELREQFM